MVSFEIECGALLLAGGDAGFEMLLEAYEIGRELCDGKLRTAPFAGGFALLLKRGLREERHHLIHYLQIFDRNSGREIGNLVNINAGGVMIVSGEPLEVGKSYPLRMEFPEELMGKTRLDFDADVRWVKQDARFGLVANGLSSINIPAEDIEVLKYVISFYKDDEEDPTHL